MDQYDAQRFDPRVLSVRACAWGVSFAAIACAMGWALGQQSTTFTGAQSVLWSNPANWTAGVPDASSGDTYFASIMMGKIALMDGDAAVNTLTLESNAKITAPAGRTLEVLGGTVTNKGVIELQGLGGPATRLQIGNAFTELLGPGSITGSGSAAIGASPETAVGIVPTLVNAANHSLSGSMSIGNGDIHMVNHGSILLNGSSSITLAGGFASNLNTGTIRATSGTLVIDSTSLTNTGSLAAASGATVLITESKIVQPLFSDFGGSIVAAGANEFVGLKNQGMLKLTAGLTTLTSNAINNGEIVCSGVGNEARIRISEGGLTLDGSGDLSSAPGSAFEIIGPEGPSQDGPTSVFTNGQSHTISGAGTIGDSWLNFDNQGFLAPDDQKSIVIDPAEWFTNSGFMSTSHGTIEVWSEFTNTGSIEVAAPDARNANPGVLKVHGSFTQDGGVTNLDGTIIVDSGLMTILNGILDLGGHLQAQLRIDGGWLSAGAGGAVITGYLDCAPAAYVQSTIAVVGGAVIAPTLTINGPAALNGVLLVDVSGGQVPPGTAVDLVVADQLFGNFLLEVLPARSHVVYSATKLTLVFEGQIPGDINNDGVVNGTDLALVLGSWGACTGCSTDLTGDNVVNGADLAIVLGNWS